MPLKFRLIFHAPAVSDARSNPDGGGLLEDENIRLHAADVAELREEELRDDLDVEELTELLDKKLKNSGLVVRRLRSADGKQVYLGFRDVSELPEEVHVDVKRSVLSGGEGGAGGWKAVSADLGGGYGDGATASTSAKTEDGPGALHDQGASSRGNTTTLLEQENNADFGRSLVARFDEVFQMDEGGKDGEVNAGFKNLIGKAMETLGSNPEMLKTIGKLPQVGEQSGSVGSAHSVQEALFRVDLACSPSSNKLIHQRICSRENRL